MEIRFLRSGLIIFSLFAISADASSRFSAEMYTSKIMSVMQAVADWQMSQPDDPNVSDTGWINGVFCAGLVELAKILPDSKYMTEMKRTGERNGWKAGPDKYNANDHTIGQMYLELYCIYRDRAMIKPLRKQFDYILENHTPADIKNEEDRWSWCDALFMAPPVWAKMAQITSDKKYLEFMDREFTLTTEKLYDANEHLYFRDDRRKIERTAEVKKVFWSRGNGWVMAGVVKVIKELPPNFHARDRYLRIFKEMAAKLAALQQPDGLWKSSLLDPNGYPSKETSGTALFCYAFAWGINQGILDRTTYLPVVEKSWKGLVECVESNGKLRYVQRSGAAPRKMIDDPNPKYGIRFGIGAFLLAGTEVYKLALINEKKRI
ncbi:MAG: hypothetical protein A2Y10_05740 [Planctomycetes bacterium GWF2_41_51]|nr:MAG: hypothetical protein A2Y10_05740 [Planctomycetes bacterium GWF2_41_51]